MRHSFPSTPAAWIALLVSALIFAPSASALVDNHSAGPGQGPPDTLCDVWQIIYNGWGLDPNGDEDLDGCSNLVESLAGTDPRNMSDCHKVGNTAVSAGNVVFTFDAEAGKKYRIVCDDLPNGTFTTVVTRERRDGVYPGCRQSQPDHQHRQRHGQ